ncbi:MAG TPA: hypothetical protein VIM79_05960 [Niastella sp.]
MKRIFTLALTLTALLFSVTSFAADHPRPDSKVAIRSNSDAYIQVFIDGRQYNVNQNGFLVDNIRSGRHRIEVFKVENYGMFRRRPQMVYSSTMDVRPWESLNININRFERVFVDTRFDRDDRGRDDRYYGNDRDHGYNNGPDYNGGYNGGYNNRDDHYRH